MSKTMKLFAVKNAAGKTLPDFFAVKASAKEYRDGANASTPGHVVTFGPDHHRYQSQPK